MVEAQEAIIEKNTVVLYKAVLAKEVEELREKLAASEKARVEAERKKAEEITVASTEAVEAYRLSEKLKSYILDTPTQPIPDASLVNTRGEARAENAVDEAQGRDAKA
ncbi:hypothetical protein L3X38_032714 [Prunus dulcis]|uniref:Uncharacterized protein n=1 Tax=Prunus dulcis TaxID=3755 RepID=A0AAD4VGW2_PRUDU|nr:hypothetical protein L3X38_032714 [Prunus dulcis]